MILLNYARDRAKKYNLPFDLDLAFVQDKLATGRCEVTGITFELAPADTRTNPHTPSLDKIIPAKGYVKENVRLVCFAVNVMHHDWTDELMLKFAKAIVENEKQLHVEKI